MNSNENTRDLQKLKITLCDDDHDIHFTTEMILKPEVCKIDTFEHPHDALDHLKTSDVLLMDMNYHETLKSGREGIEWLQIIHEKFPKLPIIMMTNHGEINLAVQCMKLGAKDFLTKPLRREQLLKAISQAHQNCETQKVEAIEPTVTVNSPSDLKGIYPQSSHLLGLSPQMKSLKDQIKKVAQTDANILILGENGTGKNLVAREIHRESKRSKHSLVEVDMGSLNEQLFESEMFGHVKGAFTGAHQDRKGHFQEAHGSSIFLDEIANMSMNSQAKLLKALQEQVIVKIGSNQAIAFDARLISATNRSIPELIQEHLFREDLFFRMNTIELKVPSLRERPEDIEILMDHYLKRYALKYQKGSLNIAPELWPLLQTYPWPGNVRELIHWIERTVILMEGKTLTSSHFQNMIDEHKISRPTDSPPITAPESNTDLAALEKQTIEACLVENLGNITKAARALNISRFSLYRKMERHNIAKPKKA